MYEIVTVRFNNYTQHKNYDYRTKHKITCLYSSPFKMSQKILYDMPVFVIEMNNSINKIQGIGLIKNKIECGKYYKVHDDSNINRYTYIGNYFICRDTINIYNEKLVNLLEIILFKGKTHSKRGSGLTLIPEKVLKFDICEDINIKQEIKNVFICHYRCKSEIYNNIKKT